MIAEIAAAIAARPSEPGQIDEPCDHAVLRAYLEADGAVPGVDGLVDAALESALATVAGAGARPSLFGGVLRIGWTLSHVADGADASSVCTAIDALLVDHLAGWAGDYDLIGGLVGHGVYALARGLEGRPLAEQVLGRLELSAKPRGAGLAWHTPAELLVSHQRALAPDGYWNLGLAHGIPGVVALLARFVREGVEPARSLALLEGAVAYLLDAEPVRDRGRYPAWHPRDADPSPKLAWCYGDLGVALALLGAGLYADRPSWCDEALSLARDCAGRGSDGCGIVDAGVCHGAAGVAHMFNRMAQASGDVVLETAACAWYDRLLAMRVAAPIAGFPRAVESGLVADASLLRGALGVCLVLQSSISSIEPAWDALLLADLPSEVPSQQR